MTLMQQNSRAATLTHVCVLCFVILFIQKPAVPMRLSDRSKEQCNHLPFSSCGTLKQTFFIYFPTHDLLPTAVVVAYQ